jgi:signal transduction histidine kinase
MTSERSERGGWIARLVDYAQDHLPRPLDPFRSIKLKIGILVAVSIAVAVLYFWSQIGWWPPGTTISAVVIALTVAQILSHGMTSPLREMTVAAKAMARGDYTRKVHATSRDEVGDLARAFNQMAADLAAADRQRRELIANVSHELRTPITALQAVLENLVDGVAQPDPETLRAALNQTQRLGRLIRELLDLSRIDAGVVPLVRHRFAVADLFREAVAEAEVAAAAVNRRVTFTVDVRPAGTVVHADRERLHQVLVNLLDNAVRHSPPSGTITVTGRSEYCGDTGSTIIQVTDTGPGIPPGERQRVFERFIRGERAVGGGTGLGLAIAHWVVGLHNGQISIVDGDGPGCRVRVSLPDSQCPDSQWSGGQGQGAQGQDPQQVGTR